MHEFAVSKISYLIIYLYDFSLFIFCLFYLFICFLYICLIIIIDHNYNGNLLN